MSQPNLSSHSEPTHEREIKVTGPHTALHISHKTRLKKCPNLT